MIRVYSPGPPRRPASAEGLVAGVWESDGVAETACGGARERFLRRRKLSLFSATPARMLQQPRTNRPARGTCISVGRPQKAMACPTEQHGRSQMWGGRPRPRRTPWSGSSCVRAGRPGDRPRAWGPTPQDPPRLRRFERPEIRCIRTGTALPLGRFARRCRKRRSCTRSRTAESPSWHSPLAWTRRCPWTGRGR